MSSYAVADDIVDVMTMEVLAQLAGDISGQTYDEVLLARIITEASAIIDTYLITRVSLPLSTTPVPVTWACKQIVRWTLFSRKGIAMNDEVMRGYEEAMKWLRDVAKGIVLVGDVETESATSGASYLRYNERQFTRDTMAGM